MTLHRPTQNQTIYRPHVRPRPLAATSDEVGPEPMNRWIDHAGPGAHPAGLVPARADLPLRERPNRQRITATMYSIYVVLLLVAASFGVFAAYQWERRTAVLAYAGLMENRNAVLLARVHDLESANQSLVAAAAEAEEEASLSRLGGASADTDSPADRAEQQAARELLKFETASGAPATTPVAPPSVPAPAPAAAAVTPAPIEPAAAPSETPAEPDDPIIVIQAKEETWIQVQDSAGKPLFTRLMKQGETYTSAAEAGAKLITGNPTGLLVSVNAAVAPAFNDKGPRRREIALDPGKLLAGEAELKKVK